MLLNDLMGRSQRFDHRIIAAVGGWDYEECDACCLLCGRFQQQTGSYCNQYEKPPGFVSAV